MAIQVNGTQVIGNSRELTNIASVDATTVAAFGAAGVGAATFSETTYTSSAVGVMRHVDPSYRQMSNDNRSDSAPNSNIVGWEQAIPSNTAGNLKFVFDKSKVSFHFYNAYWAGVVNVVIYDGWAGNYRAVIGSAVYRSLYGGSTHNETLSGTTERSLPYDYYPAGSKILLLLGGSYYDATTLRGGTSLAAGALSVTYASTL